MTVWATVIGLAITTAVIKASGPAILGGRNLPQIFSRLVPGLAPALIAALIAVETFSGSGRTLGFGARAVGVLVAATLLWRRAPILVVVACAAAATALTRLIA
jgi:branched-subunit amino acid transport protein AzlD